ncbi:hypothetical protein [Tumebacillus lipolyticus]|uniref:Uncharacterized protein n=1 Tax=Tumebacillus lipolyticus TaxID=1280370 RepID=A0ABW5A1W0_9BACL
MKRAQRRRWARALTFLSFLLLIISTPFFLKIRSAAGVVPIWLMGLVGYSWIFFAFLFINSIARKFSRRRPIE